MLEMHLRTITDSEGKKFTEAYRDAELTQKVCSWAHWRKGIPRRNWKYITLNCFQWRIVWH